MDIQMLAVAVAVLIGAPFYIWFVDRVADAIADNKN